MILDEEHQGHHTLLSPKSAEERGGSSNLNLNINDEKKLLQKSGENEEEEEVFCRVCRCKGTPSNPLRHPCKCKGSVKWIHEECLGEWLKHSRKYECELCGYKYSFKKEYTVDAPESLSIRELVEDIIEKINKNALSFFVLLLSIIFNWVIDPFMSSWTLHIYLEIDFEISTGNKYPHK